MARIFNGTSSILQVGAAVRNSLAVTYAAWVKPRLADTAGEVGTVIAQSDQAGTSNFTCISQYNAAHRGACRMSGGTTFNTGGALSIPAGQWSLVVATFASDVSRTAWVGGQKETATSDAGTFSGAYDNVTIGALRRTSVADYYDGKIHSAAIWDKALTDAEVAALGQGLPFNSVARANIAGYWNDLGSTLVGVVGGTLSSTDTTVDADAPVPLCGAVRTVFALSSVEGLTRWVDYIPVKVSTTHTAASVGTYNANGALLVKALPSVSGLQKWVDYIPVYVVADADAKGWTYDNDGFLWVTGA